MMKTKSAIRLISLAMIAAVTVYGCNVANRMKDRGEVAKMTAKMKTVCAGRFLIDLPANAEYDLNGASVGGFDVSGTEESSAQFVARVAAREADIQSRTNELGLKNLESVTTLNINGFTGKAFTFGRTSSYMMDGGVRQDWVAVRLEAYVHADGKSFSFVGEHFDPERTNDLDKLVAKLRAVPTGAVPTAPGLCFGPGMLLDPIGADEAEKVVLFAGLPGHPDIRIAFNTMAGLKRTWPTLLQRDAQAAAKEPLWMRALFSPLRSGPRTINGLAGEEAVMKVRELNFSVVYGLDWELPGTEGNVLEPAIHLEMSTGNNPAAGGPPVQSTLGQQALLDLWDKIASSIRVRPTASAAAASVPSPAARTPLGARTTAGEPCPETGWWTCADGGAGVEVYGSARQYLHKGQRMPQALLLPPQTLWEKVRGVQPSYESNDRTVWTLVDKRSRARVAPSIALDQAKPAMPASADAVAGTDVVSPPAVGTYAPTGARCPASGWWHCEEINSVDGTRWFAQGSLLPAATFALPRDCGKARDETRAIQRRGAWRLVRLAPAPETDIGSGSADDAHSRSDT